jgi:acyl-CoA dehydrogenase
MTIHMKPTNVVALPPIAGDIMVRARAVAAVAAAHADAVDRDGRFPTEAMAAAKEQGLLGLMAPRALGGEGAGISDIVDVCYTLGRACASTAMIFAMHQVKVACVIRHGLGEPWQEAFIRRLIAEQLLVASSTTEGQGGGAVRSSEAPIERDGDRISLERAASVISYGEEADAIVTTARRDAGAAASDQVLAVFLKQDYSLERSLEWDTLGMRGTCSAGFHLRARGQAAQVLAEPYETIHVQTMVPCAHLMWSGAWAGVAAGAVERARKYVRKAVRGGAGELPPGAAHYTKAASSLRTLRALICASLDRYEALLHDGAALSSVGFQNEISLLKVDASELAVTTVMHALRACGLSGYRNDTDVSVGRHLRDILSSPIMINNDRILAGLGASAVMAETPSSLRG